VALKTQQQRDGMVLHIRYEVVKLIKFAHVGNNWTYTLPQLTEEMAEFTSESMLEATLLHMRNLIEFLHNPPKGDRVVASDYVTGWVLPYEHQVIGRDLGELHSRLAHLSLNRLSVQSDGDFNWAPFFYDIGARVLRGFQFFLTQLSAHHAQLFLRPRPSMEAFDIGAEIDRLLGPEDWPGTTH
jgi:hypothetical protein